MERQQRVMQAYGQVLDVPSADRIEFIRQHFAADPALARDLERLVDAADRAESGLLEGPAAAFAQPVLADLNDHDPVVDAGSYAELSSALAPRYRIQDQIGSGGTATVYLAFDTVLRRSVAIKTLRPELADRLTLERFEREIAIATRLDHPRIVPVYDRGAAAGLLYYVMRHVVGGSLRVHLAKRRQLQIEQTLDIARQIAEALDYAHARGVVHRDIKPENILLDDNGVYVADFGVARLLDAAGREHLTQTGMAIGTTLYMSPEQAEASADIDGRSDVYSLTCVIYEMLAGDPPYTGPSQRDVLIKHMVAPIPDLRAVRSDLTAAVQQVIAAGLRKSAAERVPTARELVDLLMRAHMVRWDSAVAEGASTVRPRTIAVLPFENMSGDPTNDYFSDGMTEELIGALTRAGGMRVVARTSCFAFKGQRRDIRKIGVALGATHVLEGSVRIVGRRLRASTQLVDAVSGNPLWSERYDRDLEDIFAVQDDITNAIVSRVRRDLKAPDRWDVEGGDVARALRADSEAEDADEREEEAGAEIAATSTAFGPSDDSIAALLKEATRGEYEVFKEVARGGTCAVFLAMERTTHRAVAIKTMLAEVASDAPTRARVMREAAVAMALSHPKIVPVYAVKETPQLVFVVMRLIIGSSLRELITTTPQLPLESALLVVSDAGAALAHAHERGCVHGDLRPTKIMIDHTGSALVRDFGWRAPESDDLPGTGAVLGTPTYASPERFLAKSVGPASDQYSLGAIAYELLTGTPPFGGGTFSEIITGHVFHPAPNVRSIRPDVPEGVAAAIQRMLAKEPADRFPDCWTAVRALGAQDTEAIRALLVALVTNGRMPDRRPGGGMFGAALPAGRPVPGTSALTPSGMTSARQTILIRRFPAYDAYLRGRFLLHFDSRPDSLGEAIRQLDRAIAGNGTFAPAYAARAYARTLLARAGVATSPDLHPAAKQDVETALDLAPTLAEARVAKALVAMFFEWDRETAVGALDRAIEISPAYADAHLWRGFALTWLEGNPDRAIESLERALDLDPLSLVALVELAFAYWMKGDLEEARRRADKAVESGRLLGATPRWSDRSRERPPADGFAPAHHVRAVVLAGLDRLDEALADAREACRVGGRQTMHLAHLGMLHGLRGDAASARAVIAELQARARQGAVVSTALATVYRGLRDRKKVLEYLNEAHEARDVNLIVVPFSRHIAKLRSSPRFAELLDNLRID